MRSSLRPVLRASTVLTVFLIITALFLGGCTKEKPQARDVPVDTTAPTAAATTGVISVPTAELGGELLPTLTPTIPATTIATQPTATAESDFAELTESGSAEATATAAIATSIAETEPTPTSVPVLTAQPDATPTPFSIEPAPSPLPEWQPEEQPADQPGDPAKYAPPQPPAPGTTYVVRWGDTLYSIAVQFGVSVEEIMAANGLASDLIVVGQELIIPSGGTPPPPGPGTVHIVQPGETLFSIGLTYNTTWQAIAQANGIANPWFIYVGQKLVIPSGGGGGPVPPPASTYVVQPGDTLYMIALRFNTTVQSLMVANNLSNANMIYVGQVLRIQ
jgi:LysM repeat protein